MGAVCDISYLLLVLSIFGQGIGFGSAAEVLVTPEALQNVPLTEVPVSVTGVSPRVDMPLCILDGVVRHQFTSSGSNGLGPDVSPMATIPDCEMAALPSSSAPKALCACASRSGVLVAHEKHTHEPPGP
ncbi:hypothetical protein QV65_32750 [Rhodococcus erythropolis]|nr:hypothetical protein QV65_32750 [Rhodococcus erythropolis]